LEKCLSILIDANRIPEAAFFARTYLPSQVPRIVELWRTELGKVSEKAGQSLADPKEYANLFPDYAVSLQAEQMLKKERSNVIPAKDYMEIMPNQERKPLIELAEMEDEQGEVDDLDDKIHPKPVKTEAASISSQPKAPSVTADSDDLEAELEADLADMKLDDIDTSDVNLDDEGLLED